MISDDTLQIADLSREIPIMDSYENNKPVWIVMHASHMCLRLRNTFGAIALALFSLELELELEDNEYEKVI